MSTSLDALTERYLAFIAEDQPVAATSLGLHTRDDALGLFSAEALASERACVADILSDLEAMPTESASRDELVDVQILRIALRRAIFDHDRTRRHELDPGYYIGSALYGCNQLLMRDFAPLHERVRCFVGRLRDVPRVLSDCRTNVLNPPATFASVGASMARGGMAFLAEVVPRLSSETPELASDLAEASSGAAEAFEDVATHFDGVAADSEVPFYVGRDAYEWLLREVHLLDFDSDDLLETGREAVAGAASSMAEVAAEIDPSRDWRETVAELQKRHPERDGLREFYAGEMARARDFVREKNLVTIPDGETLQVVDTPTFLRMLLPYAAYGPPGPFEKQQQGLFYVTPVDADGSPEEQERQLRGHWVDNVRVIALHEGYPGHHVQLVRANLVERKARKLARSSVFIEGWALYCEEMMREAGFFSDAATRLCQLKATLWRAARIVVDVGIQRGEMTLDEAVDFMVSEAALVRVKAEAEVRRYAGNPTQPSSYLVGKRAIIDIRDRYERRRGDAFDLLEFHDSLLGLGSVPPALAEFALGLSDRAPTGAPTRGGDLAGSSDEDPPDGGGPPRSRGNSGGTPA